MSDDELRAVARTNGVIGIGLWDTATCGSDARATARAIHYAMNLVGAEHVALGSDFDGGVTTPFDSSGWALLTDALLQEGIPEQDIHKIMGENVVRVLLEVLLSPPLPSRYPNSIKFPVFLPLPPPPPIPLLQRLGHL